VGRLELLQAGVVARVVLVEGAPAPGLPPQTRVATPAADDVLDVPPPPPPPVLVVLVVLVDLRGGATSAAAAAAASEGLSRASLHVYFAASTALPGVKDVGVFFWGGAK
jgi:hypothetical protein